MYIPIQCPPSRRVAPSPVSSHSNSVAPSLGKQWKSRCQKNELSFKVGNGGPEFFDQLIEYECDADNPGWENMVIA